MGLLALNALFTLMKDYNLYASCFSVFPLLLTPCIQGLPLLLRAPLHVPRPGRPAPQTPCALLPPD